MFGKKQEKAENVQADVMEAKDEKSANEQLTEEDKELIEKIKLYQKKYGGVYNANDFIQASSVFTEAEKLNLGFAAYLEIVGLREDMRELISCFRLEKK